MFNKKIPAIPPSSESINNDSEEPPPPPVAKKSWFGKKPKETIEAKEPELQWPWINEDEWTLLEKVSFRNLRLYGGIKGIKFKVDDKIEINYDAKGTWYPGKVVKERGNNIYDVKYNNKPPPKKSWFGPKIPKEETVVEEEKQGPDEEIVEESEDDAVESSDKDSEEEEEEEIEDSDEEEYEEEVEDSGDESEKEETGDLEDILGAESGDEADEYNAEEEEKYVMYCRAKLTENYQVARWIRQVELKGKLASVREAFYQKEANDRLKKNTTWFGKSASLAVEDYWDEEARFTSSMSPSKVLAIKIVQTIWRYWLDLNKLRIARKVASGGADIIVYIQTAVRRWEARQTALALREERQRKIKQFKEFCEVMKEGVSVICFSRKYGTAGPRLLKFNDENTELKYTAGFMNTRSIELKNIFQVGDGVSGFSYLHAHPNRTAWCFYLELIGDKFLDFECYSKKQVQMMVQGFRRLRHLYYTMAPFYFDSNGTPRRAGPSIIDMALKGGGKVESLSVADEMRYRQALRCLNSEYNDWMNAYDKEKTDWEETNVSVFDQDTNTKKEAIEGEEEGGLDGDTVAPTEMTEDVGESVNAEDVGGSINADYVESGEVIETSEDQEKKPRSRFWNVLKFRPKLKREPKKEPDNIDKLNGFVDANKISLSELEAILDKKRAESAANSGDESGSEYEEIEVTDSEEEEEVVDDSEDEYEEEEEVVEEEEEEIVEEELVEEPQTRKVLPLHSKLQLRYTP